MTRGLKAVLIPMFFIMVPLGTVLAEEPAASPPVILASDSAVAVATVIAVDPESRKINLKGPEGDEWEFTAGPEVRNFDQIERGDRVLAEYFQDFAIALGPKGSGLRKRYDIVELERAEPGEKPGARVTATTAAIGTVESVDLENRRVVLRGAVNTVDLEVSEDIDISGVKAGDEVEAIFIQSYAIMVEPAPEVSGTVTIESTAVALGIGVEWGSGVLTMDDGSEHPFKVKGLSVIDVGISRIEASGEVFHLVEAKDLNGTFVAGQAGIAVGVGGSAVAMKNANGVVMQLKSSQKGLRLTLAPEGLSVELEE